MAQFVTKATLVTAAVALLWVGAVNAGSPAAPPAGSLRQYTSGGHVLGFDSGGYYVSNGTYALRVRFEHARPVGPAADDAEQSAPADGKAAALSRVSYADLWKGISVTYDVAPGGIARSTWTLEPGADPAAIRLAYNRAVTLASDGSLSVAFETGSLSESRPVAWQEADGQRQPVEVGFVRLADDVVGFQVGAYRRDLPLTIDPTLSWNTFLGGSGFDYGFGIAVDGSGNVYVAGWSSATWGSPVRPFTGDSDAFAAKLTAAGTLLWNTFLGGGYAEGYGIAVDGSGNVYVAGLSYGTWGSPVRAYTAGLDAFAAKLTPAGALTWNTFLGGSGREIGYGIAVDGNGNVYVAGESDGTWGSPVRAYTAGLDAFAAKLTPAGALAWNTFLGGSGDDSGRAIAVDGSGNVYVAGLSDGTWGSPVRAFSGGYDAFAVKLTPAGALIWNTFLGGSGTDDGLAIAVDGSGNVYVSGGISDTSGNSNAFAAKLTAAGALTWNTFLGGSGDGIAYALAVDGSGSVYVAGTGGTTGRDAFAAKLTAGGALTWNTFLGGSGYEDGLAMAVDRSGNVYVTGESDTTWGSPVRPYTAGFDAFVVRVPQALVRIGSDVVAGSGISLSLEVLGAANLGAATIEVHYDPTLVAVTGCELDPNHTFDAGVCNPTVPGTVSLNAVSATGVSGDAVLANITFQGVVAGASALHVVIEIFTDIGGVSLPVAGQDGLLTVGQKGDVSCDDLLNSVDALFVLQYDVGLRSGSSLCPPPAGTLSQPLCDVNGDGACNSIDALFILQCDVGISNVLCPGTAPRVVGRALYREEAAQSATATVSAGSGQVLPGGSVTIPVEVVEVTNLGAATVEVQYDPAVLAVTGCSLDPNRTFNGGVCNPSVPGTVRLNDISAYGVSGNALLANITFQGVGAAGTASALHVVIDIFTDTNGVPLPVTGQDGQITILGGLLETPTNTPTPTSKPTATPTQTVTAASTPTATLAAGCPSVPDNTCFSAGKSRVLFKDNPDTTKWKFSWKWGKGALQLAQNDFGDPVNGTATYTVCVYDQTGSSPVFKMGASVAPGGTCGTRRTGGTPVPCWKAVRDKGWAYKSKAGNQDGITKVQLKGGGAGKPQVQVQGKGVTLPLPAPISGGEFFDQDPAVIVQLHSSSPANCWSSMFDGSSTKKNDGGQFKAVTP